MTVAITPILTPSHAALDRVVVAQVSYLCAPPCRPASPLSQPDARHSPPCAALRVVPGTPGSSGDTILISSRSHGDRCNNPQKLTPKTIFLHLPSALSLSGMSRKHSRLLPPRANQRCLAFTRGAGVFLTTCRFRRNCLHCLFEAARGGQFFSPLDCGPSGPRCNFGGWQFSGTPIPATQCQLACNA